MAEQNTQIEMIENDDEVEVVDERQDLLSRGKKVVKRKSAKVSCCKALLITIAVVIFIAILIQIWSCLLYTSPSPRDVEESRMPSSA